MRSGVVTEVRPHRKDFLNAATSTAIDEADSGNPVSAHRRDQIAIDRREHGDVASLFARHLRAGQVVERDSNATHRAAEGGGAPQRENESDHDRADSALYSRRSAPV